MVTVVNLNLTGRSMVKLRNSDFCERFPIYLRGSSEENELHTYVGVCGIEERGKVFPVSSSSFARKTTGRNRARSHLGA